MAFQITARTILHLGAELISSDAVALYELIKNAIDAKSTNGVDIDFQIVLLASDFESFCFEAKHATNVLDLKDSLLDKITSDAPKKLEMRFREIVDSSNSVSKLIQAANKAYRECNKIVVRDTGHGMSLEDLKDIYLTIGTTHRADANKAAYAEGRKKAPYLGEKGVGRLAVMRLGRHVRVETATSEDKRMNILDINWTEFERAYDKPASSVSVEPETGERKPGGFISGTKIVISDLRSSWTRKILKDVAINQISRMMDPFSWAERRRFQIRLSYNGGLVEHSRVVAKELLSHAHATCHGSYEVTESDPKLSAEFRSTLYQSEARQYEFDANDLVSMSGVYDSSKSGPARPVLKSLGSFNFEIYWFNRQRLRAYEGVGDREMVRGLVKAWAGICLFRDGYRVLPYGDEGDDWLGLDLEALGASGYKLNTKQLIGRVRIGRFSNPKLIDQTNRQGLVDCPEKAAIVNLLRDIISKHWHNYLNDAGKALKAKEITEYDAHQAATQVEDLEQRTRVAIRYIRKDYSGDQELLQQVLDAFKEIKDAHSRAVQRISSVEEEKVRLVQLAGVGLMIEVIAHELTRATERTEVTLKEVDKNKIDIVTATALQVLGEQIKVIRRRLRILEPLSIPARQRRSNKDIVEIVDYVACSHNAQFQRHNIDITIKHPKNKEIIAFVIEGHVVQILENLIDNSIYWLDLQRREFKTFTPKIRIDILDDPPRIRFMDNGPGIPKERAQSVFEPFYSTKPTAKTRRHGLGLYIARQNAELLGGSLVLTDEENVHDGRLNMFEIELRKETE